MKFKSFLAFLALSQAGHIRLGFERPRFLDPNPDPSNPPADDLIKDPQAVLAKNKELLQKLAEEKAEKEKLIQEREEREREAREREEAALRAQGDYKTLAENLQKEKDELLKREKEKNEQLAKGIKLSAVQTELQKLGINPDRISVAMRLVEIGTVKYDDALKIVSGADVEAQRLKAMMPELFSQRDAEGMDHEQPHGGSPAKMSLEEFRRLPKDKQKELYPEFMKQTTGLDITPRKRR
jgi:hypothetical protein